MNYRQPPRQWMIADHIRSLRRVGKIETFPIFPICRRPSWTVGIYDFEFSFYGKSGIVGKKWNCRPSWIFPTYENQALLQKSQVLQSTTDVAIELFLSFSSASFSLFGYQPKVKDFSKNVFLLSFSTRERVEAEQFFQVFEQQGKTEKTLCF